MQKLEDPIIRKNILTNTICPNCSQALTKASLVNEWLECLSCNERYPLISGNIPLLSKNPGIYLASLYMQHQRFIKQQQGMVVFLKRKAENNSGSNRKKNLFNLAHAIEQNLKITQANFLEIVDFISIYDLTNAIDAPKFISYSNTLEYLERDWCWLPHSERELKLIQKQVLSSLQKCQFDNSSALVLGAGTGRLAWESLKHFDQVYALDQSLSMAQQFYKTINDTLTFYSIGTTNRIVDADMVVKREARSHLPKDEYAPNVSADLERISYLVGNAANIPLAQNSISAILSIYFTDVIPLEDYFSEILRVLNPGGVFFHFGPLEYHFEDISQHLSAEEIKRQFVANGFDIITDFQATSEHLYQKGSMAHRVYDNWVFCAVRSD